MPKDTKSNISQDATDQEAFWDKQPSITKLVDNLEPLMRSAQEKPDASSKMRSLPESIQSSPFLMAMAADLLDQNPDISVEKLAEILRGC